jgi:hypothetical protein
MWKRHDAVIYRQSNFYYISDHPPSGIMCLIITIAFEWHICNYPTTSIY